MRPVPVPPLRDDHGWSATDVARWRAATAEALTGLRGFERRGAARRRGVGELVLETASRVRTTVEGSRREPYRVELFLVPEEDDLLCGVCSCPASGGVVECKHVWAAVDRLGAALLVLEAHRAAAVARGGGSPATSLPTKIGPLTRLLDVALGQAPGEDDAVPGQGYGYVAPLQWRVSFEGVVRVDAYEPQRWSGRKHAGRRVPPHDLEQRARWQRDSRDEVRRVGLLVEPAGPRDHLLDGRVALEALEGSPNVVRAESPDVALEVRRAEVSLRLTSSPEGLRIEPLLGHVPLLHAPDPLRATVAALDLDARLVLVGRAPRRAAALLEHLVTRPLWVPWSEGSTVLVRLAQLERVLPVRLPEHAETARLAADARLRLVLEPRGGTVSEPDGLRARLCARPLDRPTNAQHGQDAGPPVRDPGPALPPGEGPVDLLCVDGGRLARAQRDLAAEAARARAVVEALGLGPASDWRWDLDLEAALAILTRLSDAPPPDLLVEWPQGERLRVSRTLDDASFQVTVRGARDWFELDGSIEVDGERIALALVLGALRQGERHVRLAGGRVLRLTEALRARLEALRAASRPSRDGLELDATAAPVVAEALSGLARVDLAARWREVLGRLDAARDVSVRLPRGLKAKLRDYQKDGWAWLKRLSTFGAGACLADDMGLGKTVQAIAVLLDRASLGPALVVAPTSVGPNWVRELERFAPSLAPRLLRDTARGVEAVAALGPGDVLIASYDLARIDAEHLRGVAWGTLVLDEAQRVKNARTKTAEALAELDARWRLALTGTPVENRLSDLWSLFRIVSPGLLGSWDSFRARFAVPIERERDARQAAALARLLRPYVLRRTKEQVLTELPPRTETTVEVALSEGERALYEDARLEAAAHLQDMLAGGAGEQARFHVLAALTRLRQLACHPALVEASWQASSAKLDALLELVRELVDAGHRALVFSQFTTHLDLARRALDAAGIGYHHFDGTTPARQRQRAIDAFQAGDRPLFLISLKAGGVGLNLTGADYVIHLDPWWNPAVEDQATGRAHRIGQTRPVTVYRLVVRDTVEERILALHTEKRELVSAVLDGSDRAGALSTEELVDLIRGDQSAVGRTTRPAKPRKTAAPRPVVSRAAPPPRSVVTFPAPTAPVSPVTGPEIRALRQRLGLSQRQLGELVCGVSQPTVCQWEAGDRAPSPAALEALARLSARPPAEVLAASGAPSRRRRASS